MYYHYCILQENVNISVFSFTSNCVAFQVLKLQMWNDSLCVETMSDLFIHLVYFCIRTVLKTRCCVFSVCEMPLALASVKVNNISRCFCDCINIFNYSQLEIDSPEIRHDQRGKKQQLLSSSL